MNYIYELKVHDHLTLFIDLSAISDIRTFNCEDFEMDIKDRRCIINRYFLPPIEFDIIFNAEIVREIITAWENFKQESNKKGGSNELHIGSMHGHPVLLFKDQENKWFCQSEYAAPGSTASYNTRLEEISESDALAAIAELKGGSQ